MATDKPKAVEEILENVHGFKEGDHVQLKDQTGGFTDPETKFDISCDEIVELTHPIGVRTTQALLSGGLLIVSGSNAKKQNSSDGSEADDFDLPADLPGREAFVAAGLTSFAAVKDLNEEQLLAIKGIGKGTVKALVAWAEANPPKEEGSEA